VVSRYVRRVSYRLESTGVEAKLISESLVEEGFV